jgi:uncharacterized membrane protein
MVFTLVGFGFSAYLTGRELVSIHAICEWCVSSAVIMTILVGLAVWRFLRGEEHLERTPSPMAGGRSPALTSDAEIAEGRPSA